MKNVSKKIVVYTASFGKKYGFVPQQKQEGIDYVCFNDGQQKIPKPWKSVIFNDEKIKVNHLKNRYVKLLLYIFFENYDISIYIDSNFLIVGDLKEAISKLGDYSLGTFDHNQTKADKRDCIYDEHKAIVDLGKNKNRYADNLQVMQNQIDFFKSENYPKNNGLIAAGVLIRRHNDPDVIKIMESWWNFVSTRSKRDQLSFNYVAWKNNFQYYVFEGEIRDNNYFYLIGTNRPNYWKKILLYKLNKLFKK